MIVLCRNCQVKCNVKWSDGEAGLIDGGCAFCGVDSKGLTGFGVFDIGIVPGPSILEDRAGWLKMGIMKAQHHLKVSEDYLKWEMDQLAWAKGQVKSYQDMVAVSKKSIQEQREWLEELLSEGSTLRGRKKVS